MPKYPPQPHLYAYKVNGQTQCVVRASSVAEARDFMAEQVRVEFMKLGPQHAFQLAYEGVELRNAKPEYAAVDDSVQASLFTTEPALESASDDDVAGFDGTD